MQPNILITVNSWLFRAQASRFLFKLVEISKKIYHFYKIIQKQISDAHVFTHHMVAPPRLHKECYPLTPPPHVGVITVEVS
jgi:hypothetical protein